MRAILIVILCLFSHESTFGQQDSSRQFIPRDAEIGNYIPDKIISLRIESTSISNGKISQVKSINIDGNDSDNVNAIKLLIDSISEQRINFININNYMEYRLILNDKYIISFTSSPIVQFDTLFK